jgi:hypothetical protein
MPESPKNSKSHLSGSSSDRDDSWFRESPVENPVEILLLIFIVVFFVFFPRQGCGVSMNDVHKVDIEVTTE